MSDVPPPANAVPHALHLTASEWGPLMEHLGAAKFRAQQVTDWIYLKRQGCLESMSNLPQGLREQLGDKLRWDLPQLIERADAADGASKLLLTSGGDGKAYEAVILRYEHRVSLCVSSQVGCRLACSFCQTGKLGFFRHLLREEILGQFLLASNMVQQEGRRISHVVFMGMGEPLDNLTEVIAAVERLTDPSYFGLSYQRVTVSTAGLVPGIAALTRPRLCSLAVSLHAATDPLRSRLMPVNRRYGLAALKQALEQYQKHVHQRITIEYILLEGENDDVASARELVRYLHGLRCKVNLIPFNRHPGLAYARPQLERMEAFQRYLSQRGYPAPIRYSKGLDVGGACGQLASKTRDRIESAPARRQVLAGIGAEAAEL